MKKTYEFYFNNKGVLVCRKTSDKGEVNYLGEQAEIMLRNKDKIKFSKVKISENEIKLINDSTILIINDLEEFYDNGLCSCLSNNFSKIKKAIIKYQKHNSSNKPIKKGNRKGILVAGALVAMILASTSGLMKNNTEEIAELEEIENDFEQENENHTIIVETDQILASVDLDDETNKLLEELEKEEIIIAEEPIMSTYLEYDTIIDEEKATHAYDNYYEIVDNYATKWGISSNLAMCMLTQESGGYCTNLMQIQFNSWIDMPLTVYNFYENRYDTIVLTDNADKYNGKGYICINRNDLNNPKTNISVGCIILKKSCEKMNYHIGAGIQCYNFGMGNMSKVLEATASAQDTTITDLLSDQSNLDFTEYTDIIDVGDPNYLQNVVRYMENPEEGFSIKYVDEFGEIQEERIAILPENKTL